MIKPGRNDLCPCGSGLKFKKCCVTLQRTPAATGTTRVTDTVRQRDAGLLKLKYTAESLLLALFEHSEKYYSPYAVIRAWETMTRNTELLMDAEVFPEVETLFPYWFLHDWRPDEVRTLNTGKPEPGQPVAMHYLHTLGRRVTALERRIIEAIDLSYFSYYRVLDYQPGHSVTFDDLMTGKQHVMFDLQYFADLDPGMVFYMRLLTVDGHTIPYGHGPLSIREQYLDDIQVLHRHLAKTYTDLPESPDSVPLLDPEDLRGEEPALRELYFNIRRQDDENAGRMWPTVDNEIKMGRLRYALNCQPNEALFALASLSGFDALDLLDFDAIYDKDDVLISIYVPWYDHEDPENPSWDSDTLADIYIDQDWIDVDISAVEMLDEIEAEITLRLGDLARLKSSDEVSFSEVLDEFEQFDDPDDPLMDSPASLIPILEDQTTFNQYSEDDWKKWMDDELAELGGISPREAVRTKEGREALEAMLAEFEDLADRHRWIYPTLKMIRRTLGLQD